jgi:hypothetical protein
MGDVWYYAHNGNKSGPLSGRQLKGLADAELLLPSDTVWKEGTVQGVLARKVKYLFNATVAAVPAAAVEPAVNGLQTASAVASQNLHAAVSAAPLSSPEVVLLPIEDELTREMDRPGPIETVNSVNAVAVLAAPEAVAKAPEKLAERSGLRPLPVRKARATAGRGAVIVGQDGTNVRFRKKCTVCPYQDTCWNTIRITTGMTRVPFFCPKCRKNRASEIIGSLT